MKQRKRQTVIRVYWKDGTHSDHSPKAYKDLCQYRDLARHITATTKHRLTVRGN